MTMAERKLLEANVLAAKRPLVWADRDINSMQSLHALPCPFLSDDNRCMVHAIRPYNCRRFMCGRVDVSRESYEISPTGGCLNMADRLETSQRFMEFYRTHERAAAKDWALLHGWKRDQ